MSDDEASLDWLGGLVDGEGSIHIGKSSRGPNRTWYVLYLGVSNTELELLEPFKVRWGGAIRKDARIRPNRRPCYQWTVQSRTAGKVLREILPYLKSPRKIAAAKLGIEYQSAKRYGRNRDAAYRNAQAEGYRAMRKLNGR